MLENMNNVNMDIEEALVYLFNYFEHSKYLPIIPKGLNPGINAIGHVHGYASKIQHDKEVLIEDVDLAESGYPHTPACGSFESVLIALKGFFNMYKRYGKMRSRREIRGIRVRGHGGIFVGYDGIENLADGIVNRVNFERTADGKLLVPKY